ncbi:unnamed protein product, partial [Leptidea sinapis]
MKVELSRVSGQFPQDRICEAASDGSGDLRDDDEGSDHGTQQATGLPPSLSHFVFCQYAVWGGADTVVVPPHVAADTPPAQAAPTSPRHHLLTFKFDHRRDFAVPLTEEFIEHCAEGALSIEVWGHRSAGFTHVGNWEVEQQQLAKARSLADRWSELTRKIELWIEIHELNDQGEYAPVEKLVNMSASLKSERDMEREQSLVEQWVSLTEERNAVLVPSAGSPIPGAPAAWNPPPGMEHHIPVLFLDLN